MFSVGSLAEDPGNTTFTIVVKSNAELRLDTVAFATRGCFSGS